MYQACPFSEDVIEMGEFLQKNTTMPLGKPCYLCKDECKHNIKQKKL